MTRKTSDTYCKDALKLLGLEVICGKDCLLYGQSGEKCPRLIFEDATDMAIEKAIKALIELRECKNEKG